MAKTRPYSVTFKGALRMIVATSPATARRHIVLDEMRRIDLEITSIEPARAMDVGTFMTAGGKLETAGVFVDPEPAGDPRIPTFLQTGGHQPQDSDAGAPPSGGAGGQEPGAAGK